MARLRLIGIVLAAGLLGGGAVWAGDEHHRGGTDRDDGQRAADFTAMHAEMCKDLYAREVGRTSYLEARLQLTPSQEPLFQTWKNVVLQNADQHSKTCAAMSPPATPPGVLDRMQHEQARLESRLSELQAEMPALTELYQSLTPEQQQDFIGDRGGRGPHGRFRREHGEHDDSHDGPPDQRGDGT